MKTRQNTGSCSRLGCSGPLNGWLRAYPKSKFLAAIGVVSAQLNQRAVLGATGSLAQNVNYAVKSSFLLGFLEAVPEVSDELIDPNSRTRSFESIVDDAKKATVQVLAY